MAAMGKTEMSKMKHGGKAKMKEGGSAVEKMSKVSPSAAKVLPDNKMKHGGKAKKK